MPSFSTESFANLSAMLAPGGFIYRDAHYLVCDMDVDARAARQLVPFPLRLARPARASLFLAWFPETTFGSTYFEAGLFLHVKHLATRAIFCPWMIVDDDVALVAGRELLGYPKKLGEISLTVDGDKVSGLARRRGTDLVRMEGTLGETVRNPPPMLGRPHRNVRATLGLSLPKLIAFTPLEMPISVRRAHVHVTIGGSERDPLAALGFGSVRSAYLHRVNIGARGVPTPVSIVSPLWHTRQLLFRTR